MNNSSKRLEQTITDLRRAIDQIGSSFKNASNLILELARTLEESGVCERRSISRKIKELLADKIQEGKITAKWIHDCLPSEYKREYKREVTSLSNRNTKKKESESQSDASVIVQEIDGNAIHNNNKSLENDDKKAEKILIGTSGRSSNIESLSSDSSYGGNSVEDIEPKFKANKSNQNIILTTLGNQETSCEIDCPRCKELEDALLNASLPVYADKLTNEDKVYQIPKEKHATIVAAMNNSKQFCSVIFDKNGIFVDVKPDVPI